MPILVRLTALGMREFCAPHSSLLHLPGQKANAWSFASCWDWVGPSSLTHHCQPSRFSPRWPKARVQDLRGGEVAYTEAWGAPSALPSCTEPAFDSQDAESSEDPNTEEQRLEAACKVGRKHPPSLAFLPYVLLPELPLRH